MNGRLKESFIEIYNCVAEIFSNSVRRIDLSVSHRIFQALKKKKSKVLRNYKQEKQT